jgi:phenylpyruvate tautomerase PptA (4-oxalocrotonate tautomerase family)
MPVVEIHLVEGQHTPTRIEELLRRVSERFAAVLDIPIARTCVFITTHAPEMWATGGVPAAVDGDPSPYFVATVLEGTPPAERQRLLGQITDTICDVLGATRVRVRGRVALVAPTDWTVGGMSAASQRTVRVEASSSLL